MLAKVAVTLMAGVLVASAVVLILLLDKENIDLDDDAADSAEDAEPAGDRENPLGVPTSPPTAGSDEAPSTGDADAPSEDPAELPAAGDADLLVHDPSSLTLVHASASVVGIAGGVHFEWIAGDGVYERDTRPDIDVLALTPSQVSCLLLQEEGISYLRPDGNLKFQAGFRVDQWNHLSIADSGGGMDLVTGREFDALVTGGLSIGEEGRGNSQQWGFFRDGPLEYGVEFVENIPGSGGLRGMSAQAHWSGSSIENYSGEEQSGSVTVTCTWLLPTE